MHLLFVHPNYPAQFGHVGLYLARRFGYRCTFVSERPPMKSRRIERIQYRVRGGATKHNHYCTRTFENNVQHAHAVYQALKARPDIRPDLVVGHSGFGTTLFLRDLYHCPIVNFFEYFYRNSEPAASARVQTETQGPQRQRGAGRAGRVSAPSTPPHNSRR